MQIGGGIFSGAGRRLGERMNRDQERNWGSHRPYRARDMSWNLFPGLRSAHPGLFSPPPSGRNCDGWPVQGSKETSFSNKNVHAIAMGQAPVRTARR
jgi:hypothetical protein